MGWRAAPARAALGQRRAAGLARQQHGVALARAASGQRRDVRALAGAVDAFEGDEAAGPMAPLGWLEPRW
jgi:hypothetical protein